MVSIDWAGETLELYPHKAVYWRRVRTLLIADVHFGKDASFREAGVPVPAGATAADLARLSDVLRLTAADRLIVLGDLLHARASQGEATVSLLHAWRQACRQLQVVLVEGNHDRRAGRPDDGLGISTVEQPLVERPLAFCHEPCEHEGLCVLAGHVHPGVTLRDVDGTTLSVPCFLFGERLGVLPAFGSFTGSHWLRPKASQRAFVVGQGEVVEVGGRYL